MINRRKKILIIDNSAYVTGCINSILQTTLTLTDKFEFIYLLPNKSVVVKKVKNAGFETITLPLQEVNRSWRILTYLPMLILNTQRLLKIIKEREIDVVHVNDLYNMLGASIKIIKPSTRVVYYARLLKSSYLGIMYPVFGVIIRRFADVILCVSEAVLKDIGKSEKTRIVYTNTVSERYEDWTGLQQPTSAQILYIGNYIRGKGHKYALEAMSIVTRKYPNVILTFIGGANTEADLNNKTGLMNLARKLDLELNILFADHADDIERKMKEADVVLNLSESESFSMVCLEAISFGVPLVASDCGGPSEILDYGRVGYLIPNKNSSAAAYALLSIIEEPAIAKAKAFNGKLFSAQKFNNNQATNVLMESY